MLAFWGSAFSQGFLLALMTLDVLCLFCVILIVLHTPHSTLYTPTPRLPSYLLTP